MQVSMLVSLVGKKGEEGGVTKLGADGNEQDKVYLDGTGVPKWELSWGNTFRYKDLLICHCSC